MKYLIYIFIIIIYAEVIYSNETEIIELHENKSLDQMVLDQLDDSINEEISTEDIETNEIETDNSLSSLDNNEVIENSIEAKSIFYETSEIENYLNNSKNIKSEIIQDELIIFLENLSLNYNGKNKDNIFYLIVKYFYDIGNINKAYNLLSTRDVQGDANLEFFYRIELNYFLSTFQLEKACTSKEQFSSNINLNQFLLEKIDIFCLVLNNNISEAELLNSILLETEANVDQYFQQLLSILIRNDNIMNEQLKFDSKNLDLIFLYSAMARIAELPLNESFLKMDTKNLAIPIILNKASPTSLRIKAANESYLSNLITIESLAALYQSVDFDSNQLDDPKQTLIELSNDVQLTMAFHFQLINVQIFPSERLDAIINFWNFAKNNNLEQIAYSLCYNIIQSIDASSDNIKYAPQIATSYVYTQDFAKATSWINYYENLNQEDEQSSYVRILIQLYSTDDINSVVEILNTNFNLFSDSNIKINEELIYVLLDILEKNSAKKLTEDFNSIYDNRSMPSSFILENIKSSIEEKNEYQFLLYSIISLNNKDWQELHPEHLKLILSGYLKYKDGMYIRDIILEIFKNYKIL